MSNCDLTRPIGEVFTDENGVQLKVVPCRCCCGCYYDNGTADCLSCQNMGQCSCDTRTDKTSVIFVEVKGGQNE